MARVQRGRFSAQVPDEGVVTFLIGMRINQWWRVNKWVPVFAAMPKMIIELMRDPSRGLLSAPKTYLSGRTILVVQYWRSFEDLERYARDGASAHLPAWRAFNARVRDNATVGVWHETYRVTPGSSESVYANMPVFGLAGSTTHVPASRVGQSAARRLGARTSDDTPVEPY